MTKLLERARGSFPADFFVPDRAPYGTDWTRMPSSPGPVALPRTTDEVVRLLRLCSELNVPVVPSGGRTGLAGGAVAAHGEVCLNLSRMNRIGEVDLVGRSVRVQAGAVTEAVHEHCQAVGLTWPIDLAAKGTCQIGGNLSTNAGGLRVIRYGMSRKWVIALQAVTMSGEVLELNADLEKNNTGYDLLQLIVGSEGTLAVITEATLKLTRVPRDPVTLLFGAVSVEMALEIFQAARSGPFEILAFEFFSGLCHQAVTTALGRKARFADEYSFYVLVELEPTPGAEGAAAVDAWLADVLDRGLVADGMMARSAAERKELWGLREGITESLQTRPPIRKYDVSVAVRKLPQLVAEAQEIIERKKLALVLYLFGHLGDGSPHFNMLKAVKATQADFDRDIAVFEDELYALLKRLGGCPSAEHGVGLSKKKWVTYSRTPEELRLYRAIKRAFDPAGLLNPGKIFDL